MRPLAILLFAVSIMHSAVAQVGELWVNDNLDIDTWKERFDFNDQDFHSAIRSYDRSTDTIRQAYSLSIPALRGHLGPVLDVGAGLDPHSDTPFSSRSLVGAYLHSDVHDRLSISGVLFGGVVDGPSPYGVGSRADTYTGVGQLVDRKGRTGQLWDGLFRIRYDASHIFRLEIGRAEHFWGDGYRSLFLSDNASAYPYFKLRTKVWNVEYLNLFSWQQGVLDIADADAPYEDKFTSSHMLSWNVSPRFNVQLFETIIWQSEDSLSQRGFDVYYLNPIIFYRPVEFAAGSADNAIIGLGFSYKVYPQYQLYAQFAFDEFLLDQFNARNGWWGNKFGVQLGAKGHDALGVGGLYAQVEFNLVRPFTYSHGSPIQNYGHLDASLAHPLGANFYEGNVIIQYDWAGVEIRDRLSYTLKGHDEAGRNLGGDIFRSYVSPYKDLGNFIGQGLRDEYLGNDLYVSKVLDESSDIRLMLSYHLRVGTGDAAGTEHMLGIGLRSNVGDGYR